MGAAAVGVVRGTFEGIGLASGVATAMGGGAVAIAGAIEIGGGLGKAIANGALTLGVSVTAAVAAGAGPAALLLTAAAGMTAGAGTGAGVGDFAALVAATDDAGTGADVAIFTSMLFNFTASACVLGSLAATSVAEAALAAAKAGSDAPGAAAVAPDVSPLGVTAAIDFSGLLSLADPPPPQALSKAQMVIKLPNPVWQGRGVAWLDCFAWYFMALDYSLADFLGGRFCLGRIGGEPSRSPRRESWYRHCRQLAICL